MTSYQAGLRAESFAAWFLRLKGYRIVERRVKTPVGEIDLIARRGKALIFVEVKGRGTMVEALESIHSRQTRRIIRAAEYYLVRQKELYAEIRFDVVALEFPLKIKHIQSAFTA
ncbi:MAG TPA: YraN family protein [Micavibrio sp.]|jgi:putative endonuclease